MPQPHRGSSRSWNPAARASKHNDCRCNTRLRERLIEPAQLLGGPLASLPGTSRQDTGHRCRLPRRARRFVGRLPRAHSVLRSRTTFPAIRRLANATSLFRNATMSVVAAFEAGVAATSEPVRSRSSRRRRSPTAVCWRCRRRSVRPGIGPASIACMYASWSSRWLCHGSRRRSVSRGQDASLCSSSRAPTQVAHHLAGFLDERVVPAGHCSPGM